MNPNFLHLFLFGDTKRMGGGEEVQGEKKNTREKKLYIHTDTHAHSHMQEKKQGTSLTYECHMQMIGREQMLLHLIDLYVNCIQTFQCAFGAHCVQSSLAF